MVLILLKINHETSTNVIKLTLFENREKKGEAGRAREVKRRGERKVSKY